MALPVKMVVLLSAFLFLGVVLAGTIMQPRASVEAWNVQESDFPADGGSEEKLGFLLNYAILAPSMYNSQPWKFSVNQSEIRIFVDKSRWLQVADADKRELYISAGCALENLLVAAEHFGYGHNITYITGDGDLVATVSLSPEKPPSSFRDHELFSSILSRHTNRKAYQSQSLPESELQRLKNCSAKDGVRLNFASDEETRVKFRELVVQADRVQYADPDYRSELGYWLGQGMMGPRGIQAVASRMAVLFLDVGSEQTRTDAALVNSTPILGFIITNDSDRISQIKAGQMLEQIWLAANAMDIRLHPMSQALEVAKTKAELGRLLPPGSGNVQQAFRLGYAVPEKEHTPRRPLTDFVEKF